MASKPSGGTRKIVMIGSIVGVVVIGVIVYMIVVGKSGCYTDQGIARRTTQQEDLPALDAADKVVIQMAPWAGAEEVTITNAAHLKQLRSALIVQQIDPSAGETWATLTWISGEKTIRKIWVYDYGEWGFEQPSTSWTIGTNEELVTIIKQHLTAATKREINEADAGNGK